MSSETEALIKSSKGWQELEAAASAGQLPQAVGIIAPSAVFETVTALYGRLMLGAASWVEGAHPDLIRVGGMGDKEIPKIDDCRRLQIEISLYPAVSQRRLAVIWQADRLKPEAANSLLKITEEPPETGALLFLAEEDKIIPTIKSRIWSVYIELPAEAAIKRPMPVTNQDWASWLDISRKAGAAVLLLEMQGWLAELTENEEFIKASELDSLIRAAEQRNLSPAVIQDLVFAIFKEEIPYEKILGSLR